MTGRDGDDVDEILLEGGVTGFVATLILTSFKSARDIGLRGRESIRFNLYYIFISQTFSFYSHYSQGLTGNWMKVSGRLLMLVVKDMIFFSFSVLFLLWIDCKVFDNCKILTAKFATSG